MKLLLAFVALTPIHAAESIDGSWKIVYTGPAEQRPRMIRDVRLDFKSDGKKLTGIAHLDNWPGESPISDGTVAGGYFTFTVTGKVASSSGFPKFKFIGSLEAGQMKLVMLWNLAPQQDEHFWEAAMEGKRIP